MTERLAFGYGTSGHGGQAPARHSAPERPVETLPVSSAASVSAPVRQDRRDWAFIGLMAFTGLLFLRPQDQVPALGALHLAELSALAALAAMILGRLGRGLGVTRITPEL